MRFVILSALLFLMTACSQKYFLFIGTYTGTGSKGIYVYQFDAATGKASWVSNTDSVANPSYLAIAGGSETLYACNEISSANGGEVSAFKFARSTGKLTFINKQSTGGDHPAYVAIDKKEKWLLSGNYTGGSIAAFPVNKDGSLEPYSQLIKHEGSSINQSRQSRAHVHATVFSPKGDYVFAPDLGLDKLMIYRFDAATQQPFSPANIPFAKTTPGGGPRHFTFHPNNKLAYLIEEMSGTVAVYNYNDGQLLQIQRINTHADTATGEFSSADIHISPDGKFLYVSNRGVENNIAIFSIDEQNGKLTSVGYQSTMGIQPRNFCIDPTGNFLLAANQQSGTIVIFKRDKQTGMLELTGEQINVPQPVCLKMMK